MAARCLLLVWVKSAKGIPQPRANVFQERGRRWGILDVYKRQLPALVYAAGAMAAMYITYTPVGMVRIVGLQARYFLCVWLELQMCIRDRQNWAKSSLRASWAINAILKVSASYN